MKCLVGFTVGDLFISIFRFGLPASLNSFFFSFEIPYRWRSGLRHAGSGRVGITTRISYSCFFPRIVLFVSCKALTGFCLFFFRCINSWTRKGTNKYAVSIIVSPAIVLHSTWRKATWMIIRGSWRYCELWWLQAADNCILVRSQELSIIWKPVLAKLHIK
jgi:hypothetical protein